VALGVGLIVAALSATAAAGQLASRPTADWIKTLDAPDRIASLRVDDIIARLKLAPGQVVADLGAGTGAFALPLAKAVGANGKVYAVEIDRGLVDYIAAKVKQAGVANVLPLVGTPTDPSLPAADVDVAFMHDVLHHVEDRPAFLKQAVRYLKPGARFVVIELNPATSPHKNDSRLVLDKAQVAALMKDVGLQEVEEVRMFNDKWFVIYQRNSQRTVSDAVWTRRRPSRSTHAAVTSPPFTAMRG
jgi:ubiquinone/menaquinone biosynthesis C-methylase UbiE